MNAKEIRRREILIGERALFGAHDMQIYDTIFQDGESPLKECKDIELEGCMFKWKYPLWYSENITAKSCTLFDAARAGVWYTNNITMEDCPIMAQKTFRRCNGITLKNISLPNGDETLWYCDNVTLERINVTGDYFGMNCSNMDINGITLYGKYPFDGVKNVTVRNAHLVSRDAFWNSENVTVYDSFISGAYLGWNSKNLTLVNCTVESLQGLCYADNLVMKNCKMINTTLAFEYSTVDAQIVGGIDSVINPSSGRISADSIGELIMEEDKVDPSKTVIKTDK